MTVSRLLAVAAAGEHVRRPRTRSRSRTLSWIWSCSLERCRSCRSCRSRSRSRSRSASQPQRCCEMSADYVRRAGLGVNLRTMSTPNIALQRKQFEDSDLAGRAGSCTVPQSGPRYSPQRRRPATAAGDFVPLLDSSVRRQRGSLSHSSRRRSRSRRSSGASSAGSLLKPPDITAQESVLLRQLDRIKELRAGVDKDAGTQWTPRGQHVRPRSRCETQQQPGEEASQRQAGLQNQMRELHERTLQLEEQVDDKIARRDAWLDLWSTELNDLGWSRPEKEGRRALHGGSRPGVVTDMPAMPGLEVPDGPPARPTSCPWPWLTCRAPCCCRCKTESGRERGPDRRRAARLQAQDHKRRGGRSRALLRVVEPGATRSTQRWAVVPARV